MFGLSENTLAFFSYICLHSVGVPLKPHISLRAFFIVSFMVLKQCCDRLHTDEEPEDVGCDSHSPAFADDLVSIFLLVTFARELFPPKNVWLVTKYVSVCFVYLST